jgi:hypothetical protein
MSWMKKALALLITACATLSHGATPSTDFSDLWSNVGEQGWGANVIQQNDILFITLFVSNPGSAPIWYVASDVRVVANNGPFVSFTGALYQTTAPYFGGPFDPAAVSNRQVGTLTFSASTISQATLTYSVDGVNVTKPIRRQTWRRENITGVYAGATTGTWAGCGAGRSGYLESHMTLLVTQNDTTISMREEGIGNAYTCTYNGSYGQDGRMGTISGTMVCSDGLNQTFVATEVQGGLHGLTMRLASAQLNGTCAFTGRTGGLRRAP